MEKLKHKRGKSDLWNNTTLNFSERKGTEAQDCPVTPLLIWSDFFFHLSATMGQTPIGLLSKLRYSAAEGTGPGLGFKGAEERAHNALMEGY